MQRASWLIVCALALTVACSAPVYSWDDRGHMMVAAVAFQKLTQPRTLNLSLFVEG